MHIDSIQWFLRNFKNFLSERRTIKSIDKNLFIFKTKMKIQNKEKTSSNNNLKSRKRIIFIGKNLPEKINSWNYNNINESVISKIQKKNNNQIEDLEYSSKTLAISILIIKSIIINQFRKKKKKNHRIRKEKDKKIIRLYSKIILLIK